MKKKLCKSKKKLSFCNKLESFLFKMFKRKKLKYFKLFHKANEIAEKSGFFYLPYKRRNHPKVLQSSSCSKQAIRAMKL